MRLKARVLTLNGEQRTALEWAGVLGWKWEIIKRRLLRGWTDERVLTQRVRGFHGHTHTGTYQAWADAKNRTSNPNCPEAEYYVSRNIIMCERWRNSFQSFLDDMGERPDGLTLERLNVNGNYEPGNCVWATWKRQQNNKRNNHYITYQGQTKTLMEWADATGMSYGTIHFRLKKGWTPEQVFTIPVDHSRNQLALNSPGNLPAGE